MARAVKSVELKGCEVLSDEVEYAIRQYALGRVKNLDPDFKPTVVKNGYEGYIVYYKEATV